MSARCHCNKETGEIRKVDLLDLKESEQENSMSKLELFSISSNLGLKKKQVKSKNFKTKGP